MISLWSVLIKKQLYRALAVFSVLAICLCTVQKYYAFSVPNQVTEQDNDQEEGDFELSSTLEATVQTMSFNVSTDLIFVFEVLFSFKNDHKVEHTPHVASLISYWINLFTNTIVVNAP